LMVKVAPVPVIVMELLLGSVPTRLLKLIGEDECVVPDEIWNVTVARTPSAMTVLLRPTTRNAHRRERQYCTWPACRLRARRRRW